MGGTFGKIITSVNPFQAGSVNNRISDPMDLFGFRKEEKDKNLDAQAAALGSNDGRPNDITWTNIYDADKQNVGKGVNEQLGGIGTDRSSLDQFKGEAQRQGPSNYARMGVNQQEQLAMNAQDAGAKSVAGQGATARSQLAMRGGLTGGAAERVATEGQKNYLDMSQGINQQKSANIAQIGMNDEQNRISQLGQAQGMENAQTGIDLQKLGMGTQANMFDIGNQMKNSQSKNDFDLGRYNAQMADWAATKTAQGQLQSQKGGKK